MFFKQRDNNLLKLYAQELGETALERLSWEKRQRRRQLVKLANWFTWTLVALALVLILGLAALWPSGRQLYQLSKRLRADYGVLQSALAAGDADLIGSKAKSMEADLDQALGEFQKFKYNPVTWLPIVRSRVSDADKLLRAARLSVSAIAGTWTEAKPLFRLLPQGSSLNFNGLSPEAKRQVLAGVVAGQRVLPEARQKLEQAQQFLAAIKDKKFFWQYGLDIVAMEERLSLATRLLAEAEPIAQVLPALAGYPSQTDYLFILQNRDEIRPTGGFIGTYGLGSVADGEIKQLQTHDVYHLDMPAKDKVKVEPPQPIKQYLGQAHWYFRDANWSPDWPTSVAKLLELYQAEQAAVSSTTSGDFDFVIGLTPDLFIDLLKLTGPIEIRGQVYHQDNFVELLQTNTEKDFAKFGFSRWDRKQVVGELAKEMERRLMSDLHQNWGEIAGIIQANLAAKNILVWSADKQLADFFAERGWDGQLAAAGSGDYLQVVDANMAALKTDAVINRRLSYRLEERNGGLYAKVQVNYVHKGSPDWKTSTYRTFTRIYVPEGSELLKVAGFFGTEKDILSGKELGKTWFGAFTQVEPGGLGGLSFEYKLPYNLYNRLKKEGYQLILQKQPGSRFESMETDLLFKLPVRSYQPANLTASQLGSRIRWQGDFKGDKSFSVKF